MHSTRRSHCIVWCLEVSICPPGCGHVGANTCMIVVCLGFAIILMETILLLVGLQLMFLGFAATPDCVGFYRLCFTLSSPPCVCQACDVPLHGSISCVTSSIFPLAPTLINFRVPMMCHLSWFAIFSCLHSCPAGCS